MALLRVDFQEGFNDDTVVIELDGREVFRQDKVRTRPMLGIATHHEMQVSDGKHAITVILPKRKLSDTIDLPAADKLYVGVSVEADKITHVISARAFGYA